MHTWWTVITVKPVLYLRKNFVLSSTCEYTCNQSQNFGWCPIFLKVNFNKMTENYPWTTVVTHKRTKISKVGGTTHRFTLSNPKTHSLVTTSVNVVLTNCRSYIPISATFCEADHQPSKVAWLSRINSMLLRPRVGHSPWKPLEMLLTNRASQVASAEKFVCTACPWWACLHKKTRTKASQPCPLSGWWTFSTHYREDRQTLIPNQSPKAYGT